MSFSSNGCKTNILHPYEIREIVVGYSTKLNFRQQLFINETLELMCDVHFV